MLISPLFSHTLWEKVIGYIFVIYVQLNIILYVFSVSKKNVRKVAEGFSVCMRCYACEACCVCVVSAAESVHSFSYPIMGVVLIRRSFDLNAVSGHYAPKLGILTVTAY